MARLIDVFLMFLMVLACCLAGLGIVSGLVWMWLAGLMWTITQGWFAPIAYLTVSICFLPAIAITHSIMEDR